MDYYFFDKNNCLVQISNSILKYFTSNCFHSTNKELDEVFATKQYSKVCLMVFDGLGKSIRELHLNEKDFLRRKKAFTISSVFPPTTVAATTALCSGKYPIETGWLGWQQYFKNHDLIIDTFTNCISKTGEKLKGPILSNLYLGYTPIWELINAKGIRASSFYPYPIDKDGPNNINDYFKIADKLMKEDGPHFYYMYYADPDKSMHEYGIDSPIIRRICKDINNKVAKLAKNNKDNLIIVLSDHSMVNTSYFSIYEHEDFSSLLTNITSLDARSCFFHVKEDCIDKFKPIFDKYYKDYFILKTKQEVIDEKWFGEGEEHPLFRDFLGDFLATSISNYGFSFKEDTPLGNHAGSLEEESLIDVSIINK